MGKYIFQNSIIIILAYNSIFYILQDLKDKCKDYKPVLVDIIVYKAVI